ncbi:ABC transporter ATP-binding protein [Desulfobacter sp.]|uniref:ABC transporter ATP-binding protein n=1 Tax=Desulfobacter sp. TaxID=2294 RepID=UPI000E9C031B|nr:ABC transporter ATP-binding protein [Desulfobacter sp.]MBP8828220.1 ABC transporter ATP-binding protein [Desulfobacter sp.]MBP9599206.1 ABC transporter ATP-binding protein [Desulfobacter sp.]MDQ1270598.1 spermidine/putrescine transport system ATP-binding protein [Thermodesulfobacteriota bacterium]HBT87532.1 Fe3+/spermidine/putrescine ABC transporter ATP-binding protein [Desulfobacter sp.]
MDYCLEALALHKNYGEVKALDNVDLRINQGELFTLLGPSGCGKTTLLRIIAGLETASDGNLFLNGKPILDIPANKRPVNTVFQSYALFPHLKNYDNIAFGLRSQKVPETQIAPRVAKMLEMLELEKFADRYPDQLSGGQRQRVSMARALICEPEILLLDEPMSALDAKLRVQLQEQLRRLQLRLKKNFILVTHDQEEALTVSDRIAVMKEGHILQCGTPSEIYNHPNCRFVAEFIGTANIFDVERQGNLLESKFGQFVPNTMPEWKKGSLVIRPEGIRLRPGKPAQNGIRSRVIEKYYRGTYQNITLETGNLRMRTAPHRKIEIGDEIWVELLQESLVTIDD